MIVESSSEREGPGSCCAIYLGQKGETNLWMFNDHTPIREVIHVLGKSPGVDLELASPSVEIECRRFNYRCSYRTLAPPSARYDRWKLSRQSQKRNKHHRGSLCRLGDKLPDHFAGNPEGSLVRKHIQMGGDYASRNPSPTGPQFDLGPPKGPGVQDADILPSTQAVPASDVACTILTDQTRWLPFQRIKWLSKSLRQS